MHFDTPIVPASSCSLSDMLLYRFLFVVLFDRADLCLRNFNSTIPVDAIKVKSYVDSFVDRSSAPVGISINKLDLVPNRIVACSETWEVWVRASRISLSCFLILSCIGLPVLLM